MGPAAGKSQGDVGVLAVSFLLPALLSAAGAAAAPVVIHLIMRSKPRRVVFPPLRFVRRTHRANLSMYRLKHLLLLLMRMAAIILLAAMFARAQIPDYHIVPDTAMPVLGAIVIDNSGSMSYRHRRMKIIRSAKQLAAELIKMLPRNSRFMVLSTSAPSSASFLSDRKYVAQQIADIPETAGHKPVADALNRAVSAFGRFRDSSEYRKEVYLISDMTARSFGQLSDLEQAKGIDFFLVNCGAGEDANVALGGIQLTSSSVSVGASVAIEVLLSSAKLGVEAHLRAELDGRDEDQQTAQVPAGGSTTVVLTVRPRRPGVAQGRIVLQQKDPLDMDNVRYFTLSVGAPPRMLVVSDSSGVGQTSRRMALAVEPAVRGEWIKRVTILADRLDASQLADVQLVMLADVSRLSAAQWEMLERYVRAGGRLWIVAGSLISTANYNSVAAQRVLPVTLKPLQQLASPVTFRGKNLSHPLLAPLDRQGSFPLSFLRFRRRFAIQGIGPNTELLLKFTDGAAAMAHRTLGEGAVLFWNFSPASEFSNLARWAQFPVLARLTAQILTQADDTQTAYLWGRRVTVPFPRRLRSPVATVRRPGRQAETPLKRHGNGRAVTVKADSLGHYVVSFAEGENRQSVGFSVNADPRESDLTPADPKKLKTMFPADSLLIVRDLSEIARRRRKTTRSLDLTLPLLLGVLVLLTGESFFANRFYRRGQEVTQGSAGGAP